MVSVLQVTPALNAGGVERTTLEIAEAITRAGGLALVASAGGRLEPDLEAAGGELFKIPAESKSPLTMAANAWRLYEIARDRGVQIIHARSRAPAWSALWAARQLKLPFVTTYHGIYNARTRLKRLYNSVMARGDIVIANSEFTRAHVLRTYHLNPERVVAIPRGVDLDLFDPEKIDAAEIAALRTFWGVNSGDHRLVLLLPARLTRWKGQLLLIEAAARIEAKRPGALKVILAGDAQGRASYERELEAAIAASGLQDAVSIVGHIRQMAAAMAAADVAVFPSIEPEAFGRGAIEAQAMAKPVIAAGHGGFAETVLDGETGLLVAPSDPAALAAAIERMLDMAPEQRRQMGLGGRARTTRLYSTAALQAATLEVYERLLGDPI